MTVCARYWADGPGNSTLEDLPPTWPSKEACCQAGGGAYPNGMRFSGCTCRCCLRGTRLIARVSRRGMGSRVLLLQCQPEAPARTTSVQPPDAAMSLWHRLLGHGHLSVRSWQVSA